MSKEVAVLLTVAAGGLVAAQAPANNVISNSVGSLGAALVSFLVGTAVILVLTFTVGGGLSGDEGAESAEVDTHAWIEALVPAGDEPVWVPADPTNRTLGGESHVKIGHGRRYADVPPIKGVFRGAAEAELSASVKMTRTDASPARA